MNELFILLFVLMAALLHASWNVLIKISGDPLQKISLMQLIGSLVCFPVIFFIPTPSGIVWIYLFTSIIFHTFYYILLGLAYRKDSLSLIYPIARGFSPLIIFLFTIIFINEKISLIGGLGVIIIVIGIFFNSYKNLKKSFQKQSIILAFLVSIFIALYSIVDGVGVRLNQNAIVYIVWLFALEGWIIFFITYFKYGSFWKEFSKQDTFFTGLAATCSAVAYGIVIWAMSHVTIAYVSAIRETSIIIVSLMGGYILREKNKIHHILASIIVFVGLLLIYKN